MRSGLLQLLAIATIAMACTACAGVKLAEADADLEAKKFATTPGMSNVYVYRNSSLLIDTTVSVEVDGEPVGHTGHRTFLLESLPPGDHLITAKGENSHTIDLTTAPGKNYFVWLEVKLGAVTNHAHLHLVSEEKGKKGVMESRLVR